MEIKIGAHVQRPHSHLQMSKVHVFSKHGSPRHLHIGEGRLCSQQLWNSGPAGRKNCFSCLPKYEEVQEPVGGGAVDVDHVADVAFTISCLLPETQGIIILIQVGVQLSGTNYCVGICISLEKCM